MLLLLLTGGGTVDPGAGDEERHGTRYLSYPSVRMIIGGNRTVSPSVRQTIGGVRRVYPDTRH